MARCKARSQRSGQQCKRHAIAGGAVCRHHGGAAPQVKRAAALRLEALEQPAIAYLRWLLQQRENPAAGLGASKEVLERTKGKVKDQPPPPQWNLDPATLGKMSTTELETALKHAEAVQAILSGKPSA